MSTRIRSCRPRRCLSPSSYRRVDSPLYSPCPPRCYSSSPSGRRRRSTGRCLVPQRDLKSGRMVCDKFASVCYPRNLADCCSTAGDGCAPRCRKPSNCAPSCYRSCSPRICPRGVCRSSCRCQSPPPPSPCCSPCSPCDDACEPDPSDRFVQAMKSTGPCTSRYQTHLCPWEADVTVSGAIRAHCTSTADEISSRLAGPFKAFGKRFTTDSESNWASFSEPCRDQKLSLGLLDDGGCLDFSRNNKPSSIGSNLDYRIKRIMNHQQTPSRERTPSNKPMVVRDNHISWDSSLDYNDSHDDGVMYSRKGHFGDRSRQRNKFTPDEGMNLRRFGKEMYNERKRRDDSREDERLYTSNHRDDRYFDDRKHRNNDDMYDDRRPSGNKGSMRNASFEIMMNKRRLANERRYNYSSTMGRSKSQSDSECEERSNIRRGRIYESRGDVDDDRMFSTRYRTKQGGAEYGFVDRSRNHYARSDRRAHDDRLRYSKEDRHDNSAYYDNDFSISKHGDYCGSPDADVSKYRAQEDMEELERIRFWPYNRE